MNHNSIFGAFKIKLPKYADAVDIWFPNGKGSIRIRLIDRQEYVFSFVSDKEWIFETVDCHLNRMKKK